MIIVIGSDGSKLEDQVSKRFGHAAFYLIYDTEKNHTETILNNDEDHSHKQLNEFLDKGAEAFIVGNIGPHAFEMLKFI
jgi:predicted Fe-Mo cluster-binding NifX family protein